jgi:hypothetical protein
VVSAPESGPPLQCGVRKRFKHDVLLLFHFAMRTNGKH